jgi:hypothetical protein
MRDCNAEVRASVASERKKESGTAFFIVTSP